jgi:uncharacterized protein YlxP (DUF503 family)
MKVGVARVTLYLPESASLKEKRGIVKPVIERTRRRFHISIAEIDDLDDLRIATIGFSVVSNASAHLDEMMQTILAAIEHELNGARLGEIETEIIDV